MVYEKLLHEIEKHCKNRSRAADSRYEKTAGPHSAIFLGQKMAFDEMVITLRELIENEERLTHAWIEEQEIADERERIRDSA